MQYGEEDNKNNARSSQDYNNNVDTNLKSIKH